MGVGLWPEDTALVPDDVWDNNGVKAVHPHSAYERDPVGWMVDVLGVPEHTIRWSLNPGYSDHAWDGTPDPLVKALDALANWQDTGIESATGTGKSYTAAAGGVLWFLAAWGQSRVFTFAPKEDQLRLYIWAEIAKLWPKFQAHFPTAELTDLRIRMDGTDSWGAWGYAVGIKADETVATKAAGMHAEHMLLIYEEMPGIPPQVIEAGENTCTAPHNIRLGLGNPDNQLDALHQFCIRATTTHVRISAYDHPNVVCADASLVPGAVSVESIERRRLAYGEGTPLYQSRVRGISPEQATDALIRHEWLERAADRWDALKAAGKLELGPPAKGVDVANSDNGDEAAIADGRGSTLIALRTFACPDANKLGAQVVAEMRYEGVPQEHVGVDPVGVGAGTVNEAARLGAVVRRLNGALRPVAKAEHAPDGSSYEWIADANTFNNLRSQMWWQLREDLRLDRPALPRNTKLFRQLTQLTYEVKNGKVCVESKDDLLKRAGGKSPNDADAVVYWNWVRPRRAEAKRPAADEIRDKAPHWDFDRKKLVRPIDAADAPDARPSRLTRRVQLPRARV